MTVKKRTFNCKKRQLIAVGSRSFSVLIGETGVDMSKFPSNKHFVSWCGLSPKHHQSGKMNKRVKGTRCNKTGQICKEIAQALINSKCIATGSFIRKLKARRDSAIAIKAGARKLAAAYYDTLTKGSAYVEQGTKKYEEQIVKREKAVLQKLAEKHNMQLLDCQSLIKLSLAGGTTKESP